MSTALVKEKKNTEIINDLLKTLIYFSNFEYPLNLQEIQSYSKYNKHAVKKELDYLIDQKIVYKFNEFYSLLNNISNVNRRIKGNTRALEIFRTANLFSKFISKFPFVRAVCISGSLSKGYFGEKDDIDYFIITSPDRIWLCKTILILFKKVFLLNSKKYFCINYLISTNKLNIQEKNRFTAIEFATLIPMFGDDIYENLVSENLWVQDFFPNYEFNKNEKPLPKPVIKKTIEFCLKGSVGKKLDNYCMRITKNHQKRKFKKMSSKDFNIAFKGSKDSSKHHPDNHQTRVIQKLNKKINEYNSEFNMSIPLEK